MAPVRPIESYVRTISHQPVHEASSYRAGHSSFLGVVEARAIGDHRQRMDPMAQREALDTFIGITGATEAVGMRLLQETGGDLNAAINAFFNDRDTSLPPLQREEAERIDYMEEDEPVAPQVQEPRTSGLPAVWSMPRPAFDPLRSLLGERTAVPPSAAPYDVSHPRDIRNVPVEWLDEEDAPSYPRPARQSSVSIQDVTQDENVPRGLVSGIVSMEDDSPSFPRVDEQRPTVGFGYPRRSPERGPFAPQVAEVPAVPSADVYDVEEEMIQAAIEASRRDAEERRAQGGLEDSAGNAGIGQASISIEDDDIARAVSLSLKTAEEEKRWRDLASEQTYDDADVPLAEDARRENPVEVRPSATSSLVPPSSAFPDEYEEPDEQPLLRRRSRPAAVDPVAVESISTRPQQMTSPPRSEEEHAPSAPQPNGDMFRPDEWGGISSEEQDEAMLLEAALFGGLSGLPYQLQRAVHDFDQAGTASGDVSSSRRQIPQPLSPSVVEQRLLREQQDDEYLASLAADREKELKAKQEADAASAKEKLRREEEQRQSQAAAELESKLSAKAEALPAEPTQDDDNAVTILVRLPDGSRKGRRFRKADRLQSLFDFIDVSRAVTPGTYRLVRQYPRRAFSDEEHAASFDSLGLTSKQEALFLEMI